MRSLSQTTHVAGCLARSGLVPGKFFGCPVKGPHIQGLRSGHSCTISCAAGLADRSFDVTCPLQDMAQSISFNQTMVVRRALSLSSIVAVSQPMRFGAAVRHCRSHGRQMISIHSRHDNAVAATLAAGRRVLIGYNRTLGLAPRALDVDLRYDVRVYTPWIDGTNVTYDYWRDDGAILVDYDHMTFGYSDTTIERGTAAHVSHVLGFHDHILGHNSEQHSSAGSEDCVALGVGGAWERVSCSEELPFICGPKQYCSAGVRSPDVPYCCPALCRTCGGLGCADRRGGQRCCE